MSLLENELVKKYFSPEYRAYYPVMGDSEKMDAAAWDKCALASRVLAAMQEPILKGERYLNVPAFAAIVERESDGTILEHKAPFHPWQWRIPDAHQKKECHCEMVVRKNCGCSIGIYSCDIHKCVHTSKPAPEPCTHQYGVMGVGCMPWCKGREIEKLSAVDEKIKEMSDGLFIAKLNSIKEISEELHALVRLAREG